MSEMIASKKHLERAFQTIFKNYIAAGISKQDAAARALLESPERAMQLPGTKFCSKLFFEFAFLIMFSTIIS
jgi:hypothetical protein